jgi:4-alpha-glucanotransferase
VDADGNLNRLGDAAGIEGFYWDIHGTRHETAPDTMRALLKSFGIAADSESDVWASLAQLGEAPWRRATPPVLVLYEDETVALPLRLQQDDENRLIRWSLRLEGGGLRAGECRLGEMPVADAVQLGETHIVLRKLKLAPLPIGYHDFRLEDREEAVTRLIVAPRRSYRPSQLAHRRAWGLMLQLYGLKSHGDWGIGDFGDLKILIDRAAAADCEAIGLNPLHTLFLDAPQDTSPYSPCSRLFRNPFYLDITALADFAECEAARAYVTSGEFRRVVESGRDAGLVDYRSVARLKRPVLELLFQSFSANHLERNDARAALFRRYVEKGGRDLEDLAAFQALSEHYQTHDWPRWPAKHQDRASAATVFFRHRYGERIAFFEYLQWLCEEQLASVSELAKARGMAVGLYNDLAVSVASTSADYWSHRDFFAGGAQVGAPPDPFNESGQDWGVVPLNPLRLPETAFSYFATLLNANMRHAGALRIDHVMGWQRLFLIPQGATPKGGAYVRYPLRELVAVASLESVRNRCLVVGEDLGTVPEGFREHLGAAGILSSRVLYFERQNDGFKPPRDYPAQAAVSASTHDLATLQGFWEGLDIAAKARLGLFRTPAEESQAWAGRMHDKRQLLAMLAQEGLLPAGLIPADAERTGWSAQLTAAVHACLSRSPSSLFMVQLDDLVGQRHQANLPGSITEHPNWRRRLPQPLEELCATSAFQAAMAAAVRTK